MADERLLARVDDLAARAARGEITHTHFLTPGECAALMHRGMDKDSYCFWGGYESAERQRMFFLPPYVADLDEPYRTECMGEAFAESVIPLSITGSGYRELSHRDFLGAVLHLGVERSHIGDVCVLTPHRAVLFCDRVMADFLCEQLTRVANDAVRVERADLPADFDGGRAYLTVSDTVASPRADAVVAALANLSRERAQALFREGRVEMDYQPEPRPDRTVAEGCVIVIRGCGKFIIRSLADKTRKGRYRLLADKYI